MVQQTSDGGYITAGRTTSFGATDSDIYLIKTNSQGDTLWTRMYGGNEHDDSQWIGEIAGEGYIIVGQTFSYGAGGSDIILIKIGGAVRISQLLKNKKRNNNELLLYCKWVVFT